MSILHNNTQVQYPVNENLNGTARIRFPGITTILIKSFDFAENINACLKSITYIAD
jgi:ribosome recycling factor